MIDVTGLLFAIFYILTALATVVYYRRRVVSGARNFVMLGLLPLGAAGFLGWMATRSLESAPTSQLWSLAGVAGAGLLMLVCARFVLRSPFFHLRRERDRG